MVLSDQEGIITKINTSIGKTVPSGAPVAYIRPIAQVTQIAMCYGSSNIKADDAGKVTLGMKATISMPSADSQSYGRMEATVVNIDRYTTSAKSIGELFSNEQIAQDYNKEGAVKGIALVIREDPHTPGKNPYFWSNPKGKTLEINNGDSIKVKIITRQIRPIEKLFHKIGELLGGQS